MTKADAERLCLGLVEGPDFTYWSTLAALSALLRGFDCHALGKSSLKRRRGINASIRQPDFLRFDCAAEFPANREKNREFSRFLRNSAPKTSANSVVCNMSSLRNRTGN